MSCALHVGVKQQGGLLEVSTEKDQQQGGVMSQSTALSVPRGATHALEEVFLFSQKLGH